ncbi:trypsin-like peptidase domain-containing protein [Streptomyces sp. NPDC021356]|uniref:trypsin-like peptidase domain-containing protein n=1 Tax=Streptomyces sp. NPDC021356 TaxID=3154900 RepID=UPI0033DB58A1
MNEGKPPKSTRPRWWSRPRPTPPGEAAPMAAPTAPQDPPATAHAAPGTAGPAVAPDHGNGNVGSDGDYALQRPAGELSGATPAPASQEPVAPAAERPGPLHDPDPYSTPPYGEPGPWAPAPPVQHPTTPTPPPAATPAPFSGAVPAQGPAAGAPAAAPTPTAAPDAAPRPQSVPVPDPAAGSPAAAAASARLTAPQVSPHVSPPAFAQGAPAPVPAPHGPAVPADPWQRYDPWAARPGHGPFQHGGTGAASAEQRRGRRRRSLAGGAVLLALAAGVLGGIVGAYLERNGGIGTVELPQAGKEPAGRAPDSVAGIAARALPGVVTLHVSGSGEQGTGTGFVLDRVGHILTNNHVVGPAASGGDISVTFSGGQTARGRIVGRDTGYDLAVVQVRGVRGLTPMPLGNSDNVRVGDPVVAIGAPFDLANTVTSGIISAKERPITAGGEKGDGSDLSYVDALQTDAPINPGNSGGPLLDSRGRVVGINSAIRSADTGSDVETGQAGSIGLGFAIPVNQAKRVAEELINTGRASHPVIGVTLDMAYQGDGAKVGARAKDGGSPVTPGGPGAEAGLRAGDVITAVDGVRVHSGEELIVRTRAHRPGAHLDLTVERDGRKRRVTLVLGSSDSG